jgi:endonuclease/exonuclease/phosphatase family metal-dependent hydrolase
MLSSDERASVRGAPLAAFFGIALLWTAICLGGLRENLYPNGASLDAICAALVLLAANRGMVGVRIPAGNSRAAYSAVAGAGLVALSVLIHPGHSAPPGRSVTAPVIAMTFNIHHGVGVDRSLDLERIARLIQEARPDVVGLQEVSRGRKSEAGIDELRWLAEQLHMDYAFAPTLGPCFGIGLLSTARVGRVASLLFSGRGDLSRTVLVAQPDSGPPLTVAVSQLDARPQARLRQARELATADSAGDSLLLLDLSSGTGMRPYAVLTQGGTWMDGFRPGPLGGYTYPAARPAERRDVILFRGAMTAGEGRVDPTLASTHRPVVIRFTRP